MVKITCEDLKGFRPMTEQEIADFKVIPNRATFYPDYKSYMQANEELAKTGVAYKTGCDKGDSLFWIKVAH